MSKKPVMPVEFLGKIFRCLGCNGEMKVPMRPTAKNVHWEKSRVKYADLECPKCGKKHNAYPSGGLMPK